MKGMIQHDIDAMQREKLLRVNIIISFICKGGKSVYSMMPEVKWKKYLWY